MEEKNWYVLFVMGGKEKQLCDFLNQEDNWYAFYPKIELVRRKNSVDHIIEKPLFPSYIFVESEDKHQDFQTKLRELKTRKTGIGPIILSICEHTSFTLPTLSGHYQRNSE